MSDDRKPVTTVAELETLDERDIISGYWAGRNGRDEPGVEFNRDYWHGWRNGMMDSYRMPIDAAARALTHEVVESGYLVTQHNRRA